MRMREWHEACGHRDTVSVRWHTSTGLCALAGCPTPPQT